MQIDFFGGGGVSFAYSECRGTGAEDQARGAIPPNFLSQWDG